jgi:cytochrome P450
VFACPKEGSVVASKAVPEHVAPDRVFDFNIYEDEAARNDLHAAYARLHGRAPDVFYTPANGGHWIVTRHEAIVGIVMDPEHFSVREMQIPRIANPFRLIPLNLDPPENIPYRQLLMPFFSPKAVNGMAQNIQRHARSIVASVAGKGSCDFVSEVAARFPVTVFMELMGFPLEKLEHFRELAEEFFKTHEEKRIHEMTGLIAEQLLLVIELRRREPQQDLVSRLVTAQMGGRLLTTDELIAICMLLFFGGLDTVTNASSFSARFLAQNPAIQDRLLSDPASIEPYVEESLRMFGVVNTPRLVVKDCERFGVKFRVGEMVLCNLPLAGWDGNRNPNPEIFDLDRKNRSYLIFSTGPHLCLGHFLARVEMRALFTQWVQQIGPFELAPGYIPRFRLGTVMALETLQLTWNAPPH